MDDFLPDISILDDEEIEAKVEPTQIRLCTVPVYASCGYNGVNICDDEDDKREIDIEMLFDNFSLDEKFVSINRKSPYPSFKAIDKKSSDENFKRYQKGIEKQNKKGTKNIPMFGNCITFRYEPDDSHRISVKVFKNYKLHISGCKNLNIIEKFIEDIILPKIRTTKKKIRVHKKDGSIELREISVLDTPDIEFIKGTIRPAMFNTQFNAKFSVDRDELQKVISEVNQECPDFLPSGWNVSVLEKEKYRGLPIILQNYSGTKKINLMIFLNGSHVINGKVENIGDIQLAYDFINNLFEEYYKRIVLRN